MNHDASKLVQLGHEATDRFNHLCLTGITDRASLLLAIKRDLPAGVILIDASTHMENVLLVRNDGVNEAQ